MENEQINEVSAVEEAVVTKTGRKPLTIIIIGLVIVVGALLVWKYAGTNSSGNILPSTSATGVVPGNTAATGKIVADAEGKEFVSNQIILGFKAGVPLEDIKKLFESISAKDVSHTTNEPWILIEVPDKGDGSDTLKIVQRLKSDQRLDYVGVNYLTQIPSATTTPKK